MVKRHKGVSYAKWGYIFSIPFAVAFLIFTLYPLAYTALLGFTDFDNIAAFMANEFRILDNPFENFQHLLFENQLFRLSMFNTFVIWILNFIPQMTLALALAAWFTRRRNKFRGQATFKMLFYMPNIITAASLAILFSALFMHPIGPINSLLQTLGFDWVNFTDRPWASRLIIVFIQFWMWYGYTMLIMIAGVLGLNPEMYESSEIDGANGVKQFFFITLPNLKSIILFMLVTSIVGGLGMFDIPLLFNDGGPVNTTTTMAVFIARQIQGNVWRYNIASAASMIMFAMVAILSVGVFHMLRDKDAVRLRKEEKALRRSIKAEGGAK
ncbi:MAG: sugar ABC transporter permease [Oscillospiraceae bacterium]|nr:sugar ABC transporter permease [Oscillospiraceae bacterium]